MYTILKRCFSSQSNKSKLQGMTNQSQWSQKNSQNFVFHWLRLKEEAFLGRRFVQCWGILDRTSFLQFVSSSPKRRIALPSSFSLDGDRFVSALSTQLETCYLTLFGGGLARSELFKSQGNLWLFPANIHFGRLEIKLFAIRSPSQFKFSACL